MAVSQIDEIRIQNFKFFPELKEPIKVNGNHLLLYGENGSGKSSIYWALYTLLECSNKKEVDQITKYFDSSHEEKLININCAEDIESFIEVKLKDRSIFKVSYLDTSIKDNTEAQESNFSSDFITYKSILSLYNFSHSDNIDLLGFFEYAIFPYIKITPMAYGTKTTDSLNEVWKWIENGLQKNIRDPRTGKLKYPKSGTQSYINYQGLNKDFYSRIEELLTHINTKGNEILQDELKYNFTFNLSAHFTDYSTGSNPDFFKVEKNIFYKPEYRIMLTIPEYEGKSNVVNRPHSFLNEAKLSALGLAIRLAVLEKSLSPTSKLNLLILDDLLISLDMSNRDKIIDLILNKYVNKYQIICMTHDKVLFNFIEYKIKQRGRTDDWVYYEMYSGESTTEKFPVLIASEAGNINKAKKYFKCGDYTVAALYLRKEWEKIIKDRLPKEYITKLREDNKFVSLHDLWNTLIDHSKALGNEISNDIKDRFDQSKLLVLNPQVHYNLSIPLYKSELNDAFKLIDDYKSQYPLKELTLVLPKSKYIFKHPALDYSFDFELKENFYSENINGNISYIYPMCKIVFWQFNKVKFWNFQTNSPVSKEIIEVQLDKVRETMEIRFFAPLGITNELFIDNTSEEKFSLKELLSGYTIQL
jgi:energy-coupling factor transporter ATP-binding protein EcfA2